MHTSDEDQEMLVEILHQASEDLNHVLDDLTSDFQEKFGETANPLYLHIQLLAQHLGRAIAQGPIDMRDELVSEALIQQNMVIDHWDEPEEDEEPEIDLKNMKPLGSA